MDVINQETGEVIDVDSMVSGEKYDMVDTPKPLNEAKKYLGLMEAFDVEAGNMEEELIKTKEENHSVIVQDREDELSLSVDKSMIVEEDMIQDFSLVRKVLRNTLQKIDLIIDKFGKDMAISNSEDISAAFITSFSELVKSSNDTAKNLTDMYDKAAKTQLNVKKLLSEIKTLEDEEAGVVIENAVFVGTPAEMLAQLKK